MLYLSEKILTSVNTIEKLASPNHCICLWTEPENLDFTDEDQKKFLVLSTGKQHIRITIKNDYNYLIELISLINYKIFDSPRIKYVFAWNYKSWVSYCYHYTKKLIGPNEKIIDMLAVLRFLGQSVSYTQYTQSPKKWINYVYKNKTRWTSYYKKIHKKLILHTLPILENTPFVNTVDKQYIYGYYEIEGQKGGRLNSKKMWKCGFSPLNLSSEQKRIMSPPGDNLSLITLDIKHCEPTVLAWVTKDEKLQQITKNENFYELLFKTLFPRNPHIEKGKKVVKRIFLSLIYGMSITNMAKQYGMNIQTCQAIRDTIYRHFYKLKSWIYSIQEKTKQKGYIEDPFGRIIVIPENETYKAVNLYIRSTSSALCLDLLNRCIDVPDVNLALYIHDSYGFFCPTHEAKRHIKQCKEVLSYPTNLIPEIKFMFEAKVDQEITGIAMKEKQQEIYVENTEK